MTLELERVAGDPTMGIDEAGRGPLAGPVFAAAVHLPFARAQELATGEWSAVNDSKKLTERKRDALAAVIKSTPGCLWAIASATAAEIDRLNILRATHLAMKRAHDAVAEQLDVVQPHVLVDGLPVSTLPHAVSVVKSRKPPATPTVWRWRRNTPATASPNTRDTRRRRMPPPFTVSGPVQSIAVPSVTSPSSSCFRGGGPYRSTDRPRSRSPPPAPNHNL